MERAEYKTVWRKIIATAQERKERGVTLGRPYHVIENLQQRQFLRPYVSVCVITNQMMLHGTFYCKYIDSRWPSQMIYGSKAYKNLKREQRNS